MAGGYAKRLWPLTLDKPKPLLPIAGKPIIEYVIDKIDELGIRDIVISTNMRFGFSFKKWLSDSKREDVKIFVENSLSERKKLGAIKALSIIASKIDDDCLIIAGDNLFTGSLKGMVGMYKKLNAPVIGLYAIKDFDHAKNYGVASVDSVGKIVKFVEKPEKSETTLIGTCIYIFPNRILSRIKEYVHKGFNLDAPGRFIEWLHKEEPVYGYVLDGSWWDIGTIITYKEADEYFSSSKMEELI